MEREYFKYYIDKIKCLQLNVLASVGVLLLKLTVEVCYVCSCSGYIVGRIGKAAALALGGSLIILQVNLSFPCCYAAFRIIAIIV